MKKIIGLIIIITLIQFNCKKVINNPKIVKITATSTLKNIYSGGAVSLIDKTDRSWCEGRKDSGIGVKIKIEFEKKTKIESMQLKNGHGTKKYFKGNNRVKKLKLSAGNKFTIIKVKDQFSFQKILMPSEFSNETSKLVLEILEVYKGTKWNDTCITEISFNTKKPIKLKNKKINTSIGGLNSFTRKILSKYEGYYDSLAPVEPGNMSNTLEIRKTKISSAYGGMLTEAWYCLVSNITKNKPNSYLIQCDMNRKVKKGDKILHPSGATRKAKLILVDIGQNKIHIDNDTWKKRN